MKSVHVVLVDFGHNNWEVIAVCTSLDKAGELLHEFIQKVPWLKQKDGMVGMIINPPLDEIIEMFEHDVDND